jgi:formylglycine-generating enzyme required for sulfatase activity
VARSFRLAGLVPAAVAAAIACVSAASQTAPQTGASATIYRESIAGTLVSFEMVRVPGDPPLSIGRTEVTWDLYDVFALGLDKPRTGGSADAVARPSNPYGAPDYGWGHQGYPVISVTRQAAEAFCAWLSHKTGKAYRLPTDREWMRMAALAAGAETLPRDRADALAWHRSNAEGTTHAVAARKPDALGLFDLFGNAAEWVVTDDGPYVARGGSFRDPADGVGPRARAVQDESWNERDPQLPKSQWWLSDAPFVGFRVVRDGNTKDTK